MASANSSKNSLPQLKKWASKNKVINEVNSQLTTKHRYLSGSPNLIKELELYLHKPILVPKKLDSSNKRNVLRMQKANSELDARAARVASIQFSIAKVLQLFDRLEVLIKGELIRKGRLDLSSTQPKQKSVITVVCPKLVEAQAIWNGMEKLCAIVSSKLHETTKSIQRQCKLDENARWADKIAP